MTFFPCISCPDVGLTSFALILTFRGEYVSVFQEKRGVEVCRKDCRYLRSNRQTTTHEKTDICVWTHNDLSRTYLFDFL